MTRIRKPSASTQKILTALLSRTDSPHYGYGLMKETGLKSGTLYPILMRLTERGYLTAKWDMSTPTGRPPRQHYELTPLGINYARQTAQTSHMKTSHMKTSHMKTSHMKIPQKTTLRCRAS